MYECVPAHPECAVARIAAQRIENIGNFCRALIVQGARFAGPITQKLQFFRRRREMRGYLRQKLWLPVNPQPWRPGGRAAYLVRPEIEASLQLHHAAAKSLPVRHVGEGREKMHLRGFQSPEIFLSIRAALEVWRGREKLRNSVDVPPINTADKEPAAGVNAEQHENRLLVAVQSSSPVHSASSKLSTISANHGASSPQK